MCKHIYLNWYTITSSDYINQYNDLVKPRYLVNKATFSFNSIYKK